MKGVNIHIDYFARIRHRSVAETTTFAEEKSALDNAPALMYVIRME